MGVRQPTEVSSPPTLLYPEPVSSSWAAAVATVRPGSCHTFPAREEERAGQPGHSRRLIFIGLKHGKEWCPQI